MDALLPVPRDTADSQPITVTPTDEQPRDDPPASPNPSASPNTPAAEADKPADNEKDIWLQYSRETATLGKCRPVVEGKVKEQVYHFG